MAKTMLSIMCKHNSSSHLDDGVGASGHSRLMTEAGFTDVWRTLFPSQETRPAYSFHNTKRRIDFIYVKGTGKLTPGYPSDHLGLVARFKVL